MTRPPLDDFDAKILAILDKCPFQSTRSMAKTVNFGLGMVLLCLDDFICFRSFHLHWVLRVLTVGLREKWMEYAQAMLPFLHAAKRDGWHHPVTDDKSWFFLDISSHRMWTLSRDYMIIKPRHDIQSIKFMFTIIWNPHGFHVVDKLPNDTKKNSNFFWQRS
jgi:hypothetical protein